MKKEKERKGLCERKTGSGHLSSKCKETKRQHLRN
jgi:hypothetical protein